MSTLVNFANCVFVISSECYSCNSSLGQHSNLDELHKTFQFSSVCHLQFIGDVGDLRNDLRATFLRVFPYLDTLVNTSIQCF